MSYYIFDIEEKEYIEITCPSPDAASRRRKPPFTAANCKRTPEMKVNQIPKTKERGERENA